MSPSPSTKAAPGTLANPSPALPGFPVPEANLAEVGAPESGEENKPKRGNRFRVFEDGLDVRVFVISKGDPNIPDGALVPITAAPGFPDTNKAMAWIRESLPPELLGKGIAIQRFLRILYPQPIQKQVIDLGEKPRIKFVGKTKGDDAAPSEAPQR